MLCGSSGAIRSTNIFFSTKKVVFAEEFFQGPRAGMRWTRLRQKASITDVGCLQGRAVRRGTTVVPRTALSASSVCPCIHHHLLCKQRPKEIWCRIIFSPPRLGLPFFGYSMVASEVLSPSDSMTQNIFHLNIIFLTLCERISPSLSLEVYPSRFQWSIYSFVLSSMYTT